MIIIKPARRISFILFLSVLCASASVVSEAGGLKLSPPVIKMGAFYGGADLRISGSTTAGAVIVTIAGENTEEILNRKVRVAGIWINRGKVHVSGVPSLFLVFSNEPQAKFLSRKTIDEFQLDEKSLEKRMVIEPDDLDLPTIRSAFITMKTRQKIYDSFVGNDILKMTSGRGKTEYQINFRWPKKAPAGTYTLKAYHCANGEVAASEQLEFKVVEEGFPAWMAGLAQNRALLYGLLAVITALLVGAGIDFLASRLGKAGAATH